jgi:catalase-peroxidase
MFTTDIALKEDPKYLAISERFLENPKEFEEAFAKAWFKLTHRDMGPSARYLGSDVPKEQLIWQDPIPEIAHPLVNDSDVAKLKMQVLDSGLSVQELVRTAWASAASFRGTDMRGGSNGARVSLAPQKDWEANNPQELAKVLDVLKGIQKDFNDNSADRKISLADTIVLAGSAAVEKSAANAGYPISVPFTPGRADATQEHTDVESFAVLEPRADGFRNYYDADRNSLSPAEMLIEKANYLTLTVPEMTVLVGGMRTLDANSGGVKHGVFTDQPGTLSNDFFVNLLDMSTKWTKADEEGLYYGLDRETDASKWTATPVDLVFGSNAELRAISEVYAADNADERFVNDFVDAWVKVMTLDRFDLAAR